MGQSVNRWMAGWVCVWLDDWKDGEIDRAIDWFERELVRHECWFLCFSYNRYTPWICRLSVRAHCTSNFTIVYHTSKLYGRKKYLNKYYHLFHGCCLYMHFVLFLSNYFFLSWFTSLFVPCCSMLPLQCRSRSKNNSEKQYSPRGSAHGSDKVSARYKHVTPLTDGRSVVQSKNKSLLPPGEQRIN